MNWSELDAADALIFGTPTYMGGASAGFTNSASKSGDKLNTLTFLSAFVAQRVAEQAPAFLVGVLAAVVGGSGLVDRGGPLLGPGAQGPRLLGDLTAEFGQFVQHQRRSHPDVDGAQDNAVPFQCPFEAWSPLETNRGPVSAGSSLTRPG